jgi:hypothetical protein
MIHIETDESKLANFIAKKQAEGWTVTGVCMTGPKVDRKTGSASEGVLIDRNCLRWVDLAGWRRVFKPRIRPPKPTPTWTAGEIAAADKKADEWAKLCEPN